MLGARTLDACTKQSPAAKPQRVGQAWAYKSLYHLLQTLFNSSTLSLSLSPSLTGHRESCRGCYHLPHHCDRSVELHSCQSQNSVAAGTDGSRPPKAIVSSLSLALSLSSIKTRSCTLLWRRVDLLTEFREPKGPTGKACPISFSLKSWAL